MERAIDLSGRYWKLSELNLRRLKSLKETRIRKLESKELGYFAIQEIRQLRSHLKWINAVLAAREAQTTLFE